VFTVKYALKIYNLFSESPVYVLWGVHNFSIPADLFRGEFFINPWNCSVSVQIMTLVITLCLT